MEFDHHHHANMNMEDHADDNTLDGTWASTSLAISPDGTCPRHPSVKLRTVGEDGYVYQAESCSECDKEFQQQKSALKDRKRELDRKLQELEESGEDGIDLVVEEEEDTMISTDDINSLRDGLMQHSTTGNKRSMTDEEVNADEAPAPAPPAAARAPMPGMFPSNNDENGYSRPPLTLESLANQMNMMQQMQDWMLRQKETELNILRTKVENQQRELLQKEVEIALLKEKLNQQEDRMQQELKLLKLNHAANKKSREHSKPSKEIHIQELHVQVGTNVSTDANGEVDPKMVQAATQAATTAALEEAADAAAAQGKSSIVVVPKKKKTDTTNNKSSLSSSSNNNKPPPPAFDTNGRNNNNKADPPSNKNKNNAKTLMTAAAVGGGTAAVVTAANNNNNDDNDNEITFNPKSSTMSDAGSPKNEETAADDEDEEEESGGDTFDADAVPWAAGGGGGAVGPAGGTLQRKGTPAPHSYQQQKPGPMGAPPNPGRKDPMSASTKSLKAGPTGLPTKDQIDQSHPHPHGMPIRELQLDDDAPPTVPFNEEVTIATLEQQQSGGPTSFYNNSHQRLAEDDTTSVGNTVASSTYGEDRQKVVSQTLLDPYGDKGRYSGVVLRSTGMPHGLGRMVYEDDGRTYEGDWRHGRWHGYGRATFANGDSYEGEYRFDQRHGRGKYCWNDGRIYDGDFSEDKRHGRGSFHWPDGATYEGDFHQGQREGHGRYTFSDGGYYTGSWIDGRYEGFGECHWEDGRKYKGEWRAGMAHGQGVETYPDGRVRHDGQWIDDEPIR